jgi:hypothetical protein
MKSGERNLGQKAELTDLEKADCLTGKAMGGIVLKAPGHGERKRRRVFRRSRVSRPCDVTSGGRGSVVWGRSRRRRFGS